MTDLSPLARAAVLIAQGRALRKRYRVTFQDAPPDEFTAAELTTWSESQPWHLAFKVETIAPKRCVKCDRIIRKPYLADDEPERCARCGDS